MKTSNYLQVQKMLLNYESNPTNSQIEENKELFAKNEQCEENVSYKNKIIGEIDKKHEKPQKYHFIKKPKPISIIPKKHLKVKIGKSSELEDKSPQNQIDQMKAFMKKKNFDHLRLIILVIRVIKKLKSRTKFKNLKSSDKDHVNLIGDKSFFPENSKKSENLKRFTEKNGFKKIYYAILNYCVNNASLSSIIKYLCKIPALFDKHIPTINPFQKAKLFWDFLVLIAIICCFFIISLQLCFDFDYYKSLFGYIENDVKLSIAKLLNVLANFILLMDLLLKFITGFYKNGAIINDKKEIIKHNMQKTFIIDLFSYIPIFIHSYNQDSTVVLRVFELLIFLKTKRIQSILNNFTEMMSQNGKHDYMIKLVLLVFKTFFFCHINACLWHLIAYYYPVTETSITWLEYSHSRSDPWIKRYFYSLFWSAAVMVTCGFGEKVSPQNDLELTVGVMILLSSALYLGYTINAMGEIFQEMNKQEKTLKTSLNVINKLMKKKNINFELQNRVRKYLAYTLEKDSHLELEKEILDKLPSALRKEFIQQSDGKFISQIPLFANNFSAKTLEGLALSLISFRYSPEEYIFHKGEIDDCSLYLIEDGDLEVLDENLEGRKLIKTLKSGCIFGEYSFFSDYPREYSVRSKDFSTVFKIKKDDFLRIIKNTPGDYEKYFLIKDKISLYNEFDESLLCCSACKKTTHLLDKCPLLHFIPDSQFIINRSLYSSEQIRNYSFTRKRNKKKMNALFNNTLIQRKVFLLDSGIFSEHEESEQSFLRHVDLQNHNNEENFEIIPEKEEDEKEEDPENFPQFPTKDPPSKDTEENEELEHYAAKQKKRETSLERKENENQKKLKTLTSFERIPSFHKMTLSKRANSNLKENEILEHKELFHYDFETMKNYQFYFPNGNSERKIVEMKTKITNFPKERTSLENLRKKFRRSMKIPKLFFDSSPTYKKNANLI